MDHLPRLRKIKLICLLLFTCNYVVSVWRGFLFLLVLGMGYVILFVALPEPFIIYSQPSLILKLEDYSRKYGSSMSRVGLAGVLVEFRFWYSQHLLDLSSLEGHCLNNDK